jgi:hypothetical protein
MPGSGMCGILRGVNFNLKANDLTLQ